jgi:hypothetical protein
VNRKDYRAWYGLGQAYELLGMHEYALYYYQHATSLRYVLATRACMGMLTDDRHHCPVVVLPVGCCPCFHSLPRPPTRHYRSTLYYRPAGFIITSIPRHIFSAVGPSQPNHASRHGTLYWPAHICGFCRGPLCYFYAVLTASSAFFTHPCLSTLPLGSIQAVRCKDLAGTRHVLSGNE